MSENAITTTGKVLEQKGDILYSLELMNGKIVLGHLSKDLRAENAEFAADDVLLLEFTPYDFDQARILKKA